MAGIGVAIAGAAGAIWHAGGKIVGWVADKGDLIVQRHDRFTTEMTMAVRGIEESCRNQLKTNEDFRDELRDLREQHTCRYEAPKPVKASAGRHDVT